MLHSYQLPHAERVLAILRVNGSCLDGSDTGTGKSYVGAHVAKALGLKTLVICPLSVVETWKRLCAEFGVRAEVTNYEKAWRHFGQVKPWGKGSFFQFHQTWPLTILDEVHRASADTTINAKMLITAKRAGGKVLMLSATATTTLLKMRAIGFTLGLHNLADYRLWLFSRGVTEVAFTLRSGRTVKKLEISKEKDAAAMAKLHEEIFGSGKRGSRMRIAEIADFPQTQIEVRLFADAPAAVKRLGDELQAFYKQRNTLAAMSDDELAKLVFYRQASETAKIPLILDMIEDALETSKVAVFVCFNATMDALLDAAQKRGWKTGWIRGEQPAASRQMFINQFQANLLDLIVCNIAAGGVGVSLHDPFTQYPRTAIVCPSWSGVELKQSLGRVHRSGGGFSRQFLCYFATGIEARVAASVERKIDNLTTLNDGDIADCADIPF